MRDLSTAKMLLASSVEVDCFSIKRVERLLPDGRLLVLSLTLYDGCCMMNHMVYLSDTEGSVPPSANERGVTNR